MMVETIRTILIMSASGSIIALLLFALKPLVKNRLPNSTQYYLWLVVVAALLIPVSRFAELPRGSSIPTISSTINWYVVDAAEVEERWEPYERVDENGNVGIPEEYADTIEAITPKVWVTELVHWSYNIWWLGFVAVIGFYLTAYALFLEKLKRSRVRADLDCKIPVFYNSKATTPMLVGLFRPRIYLPEREYSGAQLQSVLLHELTHLRRRDILVKWLSCLACAVHWFNPLVWLARREIDRACELSCDEAVIAKLDTFGRQTYGDTLIYVAADCKTFAALAMSESGRNLKERLTLIMKNKKRTKLTIVITAILVVILAGTAFALGAGSADDASSESYLNSEYGFQISFPDSWDDKYSLEYKNDDWGERFAISSPQTNVGTVADIYVFGKGLKWEEAMAARDVPYKFLGDNDEYVFILEIATDLPISPYDDGASNMFQLMSDDMYEENYTFIAFPPSG
jgi:beta-lactamase regulating signal transducer with metallopeptidase domain